MDRTLVRIIIAMVIVAVFNAAATLFIVSTVQHQIEATRQQQQHQGQVTERKICTSLDALANVSPPPGNPGSNPSRAYEQQLHNILSQLGPDLGCR